MVRFNRLLAAAFGMAAALGADCVAQPRTPLQCAKVQGLEPILATQGLRYLIFGEGPHGTVEAPALVRDVACNALRGGRRVIVGIEQTPAEQAGLDAFISSEGAPSDRDALTTAQQWRGASDGRHSQAILDLIEATRSMRSAGAQAGILAVRAYASDEARKAESGRGPDERAMAETLLTAASQHNDALFVVLVGNTHARKAAIGNSGNGMAAYLPASETISLNMAAPAGTAWFCTVDFADSCRPYIIPGPASVAVGLELKQLPDGLRGVWDGTFGVKSATFSPPAPVTLPLPSGAKASVK